MGWRGHMPPVCFCPYLVQDLENIYSCAVPDHRYSSGGITEGSGKKPAVFGNIHFRYEIVVRGCFGNDALDDCVRVGIPSEPPVHLGQTEIYKQKFLPLVPILINGWIGQYAANTPIAARSHSQKFHSFNRVAHDCWIGDDPKIDYCQQRAVDIVFHPSSSVPRNFSSLIKATAKPCSSRATLLRTSVRVASSPARRAISAKLRRPTIAEAVEKAKCFLSFCRSSQIDVSAATISPSPYLYILAMRGLTMKSR